MSLKNFLAYTNPITIATGVPIVIGIAIKVMAKSLVKDTVRETKELLESVM